MANAHRGEVSVVIGGATYTLALTLNAMCETEAHFGMRWQEIAEQAESGSLPHVLRLLYACTRKHHKDLTIEEFGEIEIGDVPMMANAVRRVLEAAQPDQRDTKVLSGSKRPPKAQVHQANGTGVGLS